MKKLLSYTLPLIVSFFALVPFIQFYLLAPPFNFWPMMIILFAFAGIMLCFTDVNLFVKLTVALSFGICFFSSAPYASFNQFCSIVACCWLYYGFTLMSDTRIMDRSLMTIFLINTSLLTMQHVGQDTLMNFGVDEIERYGVIGHHMQMGSLALVLSACIAIISPVIWFWPVVVGLACNSAWTLFCAFFAILATYRGKAMRLIAVVVLALAIGITVKCNKIPAALSDHSGRVFIWQESVRLLNERPLTGWGPGMYKYVFMPLSNVKGVPVKTAHNDWVQFAFEVGYPIFVLMAFGWVWVFAVAVFGKQYRFLIGYSVISFDMLVHFPCRMIQTVPLIILFLAIHNEVLCKTSRKFINRFKYRRILLP